MNTEFIKAWLKVQKGLSPIKKGSKVDFGKVKYTYADLQSIWEVIHPLLVENNIIFTQSLETKEEDTYLVSSLVHESGEIIVTKVKIEFTGNNIKDFGSAISYYRRYAIQCIFSIVTTDKDVEQLEKPITKKKKRSELITQDQADIIKDLLDTEELTDWFSSVLNRRGMERVEDLTKDVYEKTLEFIEDKKKEK